MSDRPVEQDQPGQDAPRRGASARFSVSAAAGAEAAMREAMDPANQSLADALRLSYRVLQVAILALVAVFLLSGFQQVQEGQTGVKTLFGRIVGEPGAEQVSPGLQPFWPYPVGEVVLLPQKDAVELNSEFFPRLAANATTIEAAAGGSTTADPIRPGRDGSLVTADGDLAHVRIVAEYLVEDPVRTLDEFRPEALREVVRKALCRSMVQVAARYTLAELVDGRDGPVDALREGAQRTLDAIRSGVRITSVVFPERTAPLAIRNSYGRVQEAREEAKLAAEKAQQEANTTLVGMAGPAWPEVVELIQRYEVELTRGDVAAADAVMEEIGRRFESGSNFGQTSAIIARAQAFRATVRATLGKEAGRLAGLAPAFRENPGQLVRTLWLDAMRQVMASPTAEIVAAPMEGGAVRLDLESSNDVMQARRQSEVERRKRRAMQPVGGDEFQLGSRQIMIDAPGRRLDRSASGGFGRQ
jgi:regulator of protease activity HflC (stomatin/prohibitin superfamily)